MSVTRAPRATAVRANAYPCLPEDRLPRYRTGSSGSRVPPAVTTTCRPASEASAAVPRRNTRCATSKISTGSGSRPLPVSAPVSRPEAGSITITPRDRSVATFATVAGCSHISVCIAGTSTTGQRAVSSVFVSRSSASPCAALASRSAVAGATTTRSAHWPIATCGTSCTSAHTPVATGWPDSAAHVASPTKRSADAVGTTRTGCPDSVNRRSSSQALYAAIPPATPNTTRADAGWSACGRPAEEFSPARIARLLLGLLRGQQVAVDLAQRDRQRLLLRSRLYQRPDVLEQALTELA